AVRNFDLVEVAPTVGGFEELYIQHVQRIGILRIGDDVHVVPRPLKQAVAAVYEIPCVAAIVGTVKAAVFSFDQRVHAFGVRRDRQPNAPVGTLRKPVFILLQSFPCRTAVRRAIDAAARPTAGQGPRSPPRLPQRGKQNVGILRIENYIDRPCVLVFVENLVPGLAAVGGSENPPFRVRTKGMTQRRHKNYIGIARVHDHFADGARIFQANGLPGFSRIHRLPDAIALRNISANAGFASPYINDVRVGDGNGNTADRRRSILVKNRRPGVGTVGGFPHAATSRTEIVGRRVAGNSGCRQRAATTKRTDRTVLHSLEQRIHFVLVVFVVFRRWRGRGGSALLRGIRLAVPPFLLGESQ